MTGITEHGEFPQPVEIRMTGPDTFVRKRNNGRTRVYFRCTVEGCGVIIRKDGAQAKARIAAHKAEHL